MGPSCNTYDIAQAESGFSAGILVVGGIGGDWNALLGFLRAFATLLHEISG